MQRSLRCAAALSIRSCVSVSLMDIILPFVSGSSAYPAPHQNEPRIDAIDGAKGCPPVILGPADVHIHALFRRERQSFLRQNAVWVYEFARPVGSGHSSRSCSKSMGKSLTFTNALPNASRFESPQLHQEVRANRRDFPRSEIARDFRSLRTENGL